MGTGILPWDLPNAQRLLTFEYCQMGSGILPYNLPELPTRNSVELTSLGPVGAIGETAMCFTYLQWRGGPRWERTYL